MAVLPACKCVSACITQSNGRWHAGQLQTAMNAARCDARPSCLQRTRALLDDSMHHCGRIRRTANKRIASIGGHALHAADHHGRGRWWAKRRVAPPNAPKFSANFARAAFLRLRSLAVLEPLFCARLRRITKFCPERYRTKTGNKGYSLAWSATAIC